MLALGTNAGLSTALEIDSPYQSGPGDHMRPSERVRLGVGEGLVSHSPPFKGGRLIDMEDKGNAREKKFPSASDRDCQGHD